MGIKCIIKHGSLRRNNVEYRVGDEVPGLSPEAIERHEKNGLITVCDTTDVPVFEPPDVMVETFDEPVTTKDWEDSEVVEPKSKPKKRKKKKASKSGGD